MPSRASGWIFGLVLITLGGLFILQNLTGFEFHNWWALFILIPAISSFVSAWNGYQSEHRFTQHVRSSLVGGFILLLITLAFLFTFSWTLLWPLILVLAGVGILINGLLKD
jgi:phosphatidylserine synthase